MKSLPKEMILLRILPRRVLLSPRKVTPPPTMKVHLKRREKISQKRNAKARKARRKTVKSLPKEMILLRRNLLSSPRRMKAPLLPLPCLTMKVHLMREMSLRSPAKVAA